MNIEKYSYTVIAECENCCNVIEVGEYDDEEDDFDIGHGASGKSRGGKGRKKDDASDDDYDINFIDL